MKIVSLMTRMNTIKRNFAGINENTCTFVINDITWGRFSWHYILRKYS